MDQALYAKACEVAWKHKGLYAEVLNSQAGNFSYNFEQSLHNWQTVLRRWFAWYLPWIRDNRRRFSLRHSRRRCTIVRFELTLHICEALLRLIWRQFIPWVMNNYPNKLTHLRAIQSKAEKWLKPSVCRSTIASWTASPFCRCTSCGVNTWSISATRIGSCPPFGCPTSTLLGRCC